MKKTALVTGGMRGIGLGISKELAKNGFNLVLCGRRNEDSVSDKMKDFTNYGIKALYCQCDISNANQRKKMLKKITKEFGTLHILINNAGIAPKERKDILEASEESFEELIKINLQGPYFLTQAVANLMIKEKEKNIDFNGSIINISSVSSTMASIKRGEYCISKAGITMATKLWALRLAEYGISVHEIRPGIILTDMTSAVKEKYDTLIKEGLVPMKRWGLPEDIGKTVVAIVKGGISYATGQPIVLDGGLSIEQL
ncbi:MAG: 3-ketoacyl-ACP reductase [Verrucomicrobiota bacterium]|nr:3-ketoacyl-ACP reductase [Verrucomicrobiota bacterium]